MATVLAFPMASMAGGHGDGTAALAGPHGEAIVSLEEPAVYEIEGREGTVVFEVRAGSVYCVESSCAEQICVRQREVRQGRPVVCAPNGVTAMLSAQHGDESEEASLDAVSR
jgi:hypothetical protein